MKKTIVITLLLQILCTNIFAEEENIIQLTDIEVAKGDMSDDEYLNLTTYYVSSENLNVHVTPSLTSKVIASLSLNTKIQVISVDSEWAIIYYDGKIRYVLANSISESENTKAMETQYTNSNQQIFSPTTYASSSNNTTTASSVGKTPTQSELNPIYTTDGTTFICGDRKMTRTECIAFLKANCSLAYSEYLDAYNSGNSLSAGGDFSAIIGGIGGGIGLVCTIVGVINGFNTGLTYVSALGWGVAGICFTVATPLWIVGGVKLRNCLNWGIEKYNEHCADRKWSNNYNLQLNLQASQNGIGLALQF